MRLVLYPFLEGFIELIKAGALACEAIRVQLRDSAGLLPVFPRSALASERQVTFINLRLEL